VIASRRTRRAKVHGNPAATLSAYPRPLRQLAVTGPSHDQPTLRSARARGSTRLAGLAVLLSGDGARDLEAGPGVELNEDVGDV